MCNYPAGAAYDSNAPYNQTDLSDIYGDAADEQIDAEIDDNEDVFLEWACDNDLLPEDYTDEDVKRITGDNEIRNRYRRHRFDDVCVELAEEAADKRAYYECERAEAARERYLLGD